MKYPVSLVLIVYNTIDWIEDCLNSIFSQTLPCFQTVIVDNASSDGTSEKISELIKGKNNVIYIRNEENLGGAAAGNIGITKSEGEYVFLMDSDDKLLPRSLEALYTCAEETGSDIVIGRGKSIVDEGRITNFAFRLYSITGSLRGTYNNVREKKELLISPFYWGRLYKKSLLTENEIFMINNEIYADMHFNCKALLRAQKISVTDELCYLWRRLTDESVYVSITSLTNQKNLFAERVESYNVVEELFSADENADLLKYIRLCNLVKLLIPAKFAADDDEFLKLYAKIMKPVIEKAGLENIYDCPYIISKKKLLCFFLANDMLEEAKFFSRQEYDIPGPRSGKFRYTYVNTSTLPAGLPKKALRQARTKLRECELLNFSQKDDCIEFSGVCDVSVLSRLWLSRAIILDSKGEELSMVHIKNSKRRLWILTKESFTASFPKSALDKLKNGDEFSVVIEAMVNGGFSDMPLCKKYKTLTFIKTENGIKLQENN